LQSAADLDQQPIAVVVTEGVVDLLEPVQVEHGQRRRDQLAVGVSDRLADTVVQQGAVGEARKPVVQRLVLVLGGLAFDAPLVADQGRKDDGQRDSSDGQQERRGGHDLPA